LSNNLYFLWFLCILPIKFLRLQIGLINKLKSNITED